MKRFTGQLFVNRVKQYVTRNVKERSDKILRLWTAQCEYILAQRFRRSQQMISLYAKLWEDRALKEIIYQFRRQVNRNAVGLMYGSLGICAYDWDRERISYASVRDYIDDVDNIKNLQTQTVICNSCKQRKIIDCRLDNIVYCSCKHTTNQSKNIEWNPYIERKNMMIWRKEQKPGLFAYKVYAFYNDVTAEDFLFVQTDMGYRKIWDKTAMALDVIDTDPVNKNSSHVIYWEMLWPKLFSNRDYVYYRRFFVDRKRKVIIIVNKSTRHPKCPPKPANQRVNEYWSYLVIKPKTQFNKPGLEFVLTYFDNPGVSMPPAVTSWVAKKQMPDFLNNLHMATLQYAQQKKKRHNDVLDPWENIKDPGFEYPPEPEAAFNAEEEAEVDQFFEDSLTTNETVIDNGHRHESIDALGDISDETEPKKSYPWWTYLIPYYYFV